MTLPALRRNEQELSTRWGDPFAEFNRLSQEMNRLAERFFGQWPANTSAEAYTPLADIEETEDAYVVEVEVPGVKKEDLSVEVQGRRIVIQGERKERERTGVFRTKTRTTGRFYFEGLLPGDIDENSVSASLTDGVLAVRVPKHESERSKAKVIEVQQG